MNRLRERAGDPESGQIMILTLGLAMVVLGLIFVVVSVTSVQIERKQLLAMADAAALDAAGQIDEATYFTRGDGEVRLTDVTVRSAVDGYLAENAAALGLERARAAQPTGSPDGRSAQVTLTTVAEIPLVPWFMESMGGGIRLQVSTVARAG